MTDSNEPSLTIIYTNYRGYTSKRIITPIKPWFGSTEWHPEPQWLLTAFDHEKQANRDFALKDFGYSDHSPRAQALEEAARFIEENIEVYGSDGVEFRPRQEANRNALAYPAAIRALSSQPVADHIADAGKMVADRRKYCLGERLTKNKGSSWTGRVVGFYSTELTPIGYAIESETEKGSVQIYPEAALRLLPSSPEASQ